MEAGKSFAAGSPSAAHPAVLRNHLIDAFKGLKYEHKLGQAGGDLDFELKAGLQPVQDVVHASGGHQPSLLDDADRGTEILHFRENVAGNEDGSAHGVKLLDQLAEFEP